MIYVFVFILFTWLTLASPPLAVWGQLCGYKWMTCAPARITFSVAPLSCDVEPMYRPRSIAQILYATCPVEGWCRWRVNKQETYKRQNMEKICTGWWFGWHFLFSHILGMIIPIDFHIFQRVWNHQPVYIYIDIDCTKWDVLILMWEVGSIACFVFWKKSTWSQDGWVHLWMVDTLEFLSSCFEKYLARKKYISLLAMQVGHEKATAPGPPRAGSLPEGGSPIVGSVCS